MNIISRLKTKIKSKLVIETTKAITVPLLDGELLEGYTAFISGGTGGIGIAIAERFVANGCKVILSGRNEQKLISACSRIGSNCRYLVMDLNDDMNYSKIVAQTVSILDKNEKIDIVVNCAGVHGPSDFWTITPSDWDSVIDTNLKSMYFICQSFGRYMRDNNIHGHILNIGSASALKPGKTPYEISKNAVRALTLGVAAELIKYGIVVNCLAPGPTATSMLNRSESDSLAWPANPSGRIALPEEIANWAVLMASNMADYIVGDSLYVTGGSGTICIDK